jgi:hypothetical protein
LGVTWGVAWGAIFALISVIIGFVDPGSVDPGEGPIRIGGIGFIYGFVSGAGFGVLLSVSERRKGILELSMTRAIVWGILGTAMFPLLTTVHGSMLLIVCPIGAALAAGSLALAKHAALRAAPDQPKLP